ncbi:MAG: right-handed parallel beta-helix repeat-containing protein [Sandaracinaceae bacterium]
MALLLSPTSCATAPERVRAPAAAEACIRVEDLPMQVVGGDQRIVHLGDGPGWAGRRVTLCPRDRPLRRMRFKVRQSGVSLDCGGNELSGEGETDADRMPWALDVDRSLVPAPSDVTITNCTFRGYRRGLVFAGPDITDFDPQKRLRRFRVHDVRILDAAGEAIYIGAHTRDVTLERVEVRNATLTAVYLDAYSRGTVIRDSVFVHNGWSRCSLGREAIAIDASTNNLIVGNHFEDNRFAAIALYKNCGESDTPRNQPADHNRIEGNSFRGHCSESGAAVILASRQGVDLSTNDCLSDVCLDPPVWGARRRDHARFNTVAFNRFEGNRYDARILDGYNRFVGNWLGERGCEAGEGPRVLVGSELLAAIGEPIEGVSVARNRSLTEGWLRIDQAPPESGEPSPTRAASTGR